jgi:hypothetical protein
MPPTKANEVPRHWRRTDVPHRHAGRSLGTVVTAAAGLALGGIVSWAVTGDKAYDGATDSLGERRAVTAEGIGDDRPSNEAVVPVPFSRGGLIGDDRPSSEAAVLVPFSRGGLVGDDRSSSATATTSGAAAYLASTWLEAGGAASSPGATTPVSVSGWWLPFFAGAVGPTVTSVGDASTTTSAPSTTRPPATPPTTTGPTPPTTTGPTPTTTTGPTPTTTSSTTTSSTTSTTAPPTTDTTTEEDPTSTTTEVDPTSTTDPGAPGEDG